MHALYTHLQSLPLQTAIDNIFVDPTNGHLWVAILAKPLSVAEYFVNHSTPVASRILHVSIDESATMPFTGSKVEEVFSSDGEDFGATTIGLYHDGKLLVGTIAKDMMYCEVPTLMYPN